MNIFLVLPAYNEEKGLQNLLPLLTKLSYSILIVDDCSSDRTAEVLKSYKEVHVISNKTNKGYAKSLTLGISCAFSKGASHVITLDSDGQHPHGAIAKIVSCFSSGSNCVLTSRVGPKPRFSEWLISFICFQIWGVSDIYSGMRGFSHEFWLMYFHKTFITPCLEYPFVHALAQGYQPDTVSITPLSRIEGSPRFAANLLADYIIFNSFFQSIISL